MYSYLPDADPQSILIVITHQYKAGVYEILVI